MVEHGQGRHRRVAALAASLAIVVAAAGLWIADGGRTPAPIPAAAGSPSGQVPATSAVTSLDGQRPVRPASGKGAARGTAIERRPGPAVRRTGGCCRRKADEPQADRRGHRSIAGLDGQRRSGPIVPMADPDHQDAAGRQVRRHPVPRSGHQDQARFRADRAAARVADPATRCGVRRPFHQRHVRPADGADRHRRATHGSTGSGHHQPQAGRNLAVDRHQHPPIRRGFHCEGRPVTDGYRLHHHGAGRHPRRRRRDPASSGHGHLQHAGADDQALSTHRRQHEVGSRLRGRLRPAG